MMARRVDMSTREELVKAVEDAEVAARDYAADDSWSALMAAKNALKAYDKENT
jgi:hypothetical protein